MNGPMASLDLTVIRMRRSTPFDAPTLPVTLASATQTRLDELPFGVLALAAGGKVASYNAFAQRLWGLGREVVGRDFFAEVAPCTNNLMIRERFVAAWRGGPALDEELRFTFSYPMRYTRVALRLLTRGARGWLAVKTT
jgi:photoactive yellow protein